MSVLLVVVGALVGAPLRLWVTQVAVRRGRDAAIGTLAVNVGGCGILGVLTGTATLPAWALVLVGTGFCGALTTFSTFGADVLRLASTRRSLIAVGYAAASVVLGLGAAAAGWALAEYAS